MTSNIEIACSGKESMTITYSKGEDGGVIIKLDDLTLGLTVRQGAELLDRLMGVGLLDVVDEMKPYHLRES